MARRYSRGCLVALTFTLTAALGITACRDSSTKDAPAASADASVVTATTAGPLAPSASPVDNRDGGRNEAHDEADGDGGRDAGRPRRRRLLPDAAVETEPTPAAGASVEASPDPRLGKRRANPMGDDSPYGGTGASAAPVLQKKPLPDEDPWGAKPPTEPPAH